LLVEILFFTFILYIVFTLYFCFKYPELRWNWDDISIDNMSFPSSFIWGTATAAHQVEGNCINNWSEFEKGSKNDGQPNIKDNQQSGIGLPIIL
jgi:beta-glucosidase